MPESDASKSDLIWNAVLRDAAGTLSAYYTPKNYTLENLSLYSSSFNSEDFFINEINRRIDLGRANVFASLLPQVEKSLTKAYRHQIYYSHKVVSGKINIPRLLLMRARGDQRIPVVRAERQLITPENLLISELLNFSIEVIKPWVNTPGAEGKFALNLSKKFQAVESSYPWAELRHTSRPILRELTQIVLARAKMGVTEPNGPFQQLAEIFSNRFTEVTAFEKSSVQEAFTQPIFLLISQQPEFEDRVFELLCLGWLINALTKCADSIEINRSGIKGSNKGPLLTTFYRESKIELYFQSAFEVLDSGTWIDTKSKKSLKGIPDIILRVTKSEASRLAIIDAKNRSKASESEVAYKLIGYKDNFRLDPFFGIGLYPSFGEYSYRHLNNKNNDIYLLRLPLPEAKKIIQKNYYRQINSIINNL